MHLRNHWKLNTRLSLGTRTIYYIIFIIAGKIKCFTERKWLLIKYVILIAYPINFEFVNFNSGTEVLICYTEFPKLRRQIKANVTVYMSSTTPVKHER